MEVKECGDKNLWDTLVGGKTPDGGLLQSWAWGDFQERYGREVGRLVVSSKQGAEGGWQYIIMKARKGGRYMYVPRPMPVPDKDAFSALSSELTLRARKHGCVFIRVDAVEDEFSDHAYKHRGNITVQPRQELVISIADPPEALLAAMKQKTRYNIRVAEKHGIVVRPGHSAEALYELIEKTAKRQRITSHDREYYTAMAEVLVRDKMAEIFVAEHEGNPIAAALLTLFGGTATYLHGGADNAHRKFMAPYLLHWHMIKHTRELGYRRYNFGGISHDKKSWAGITRFKEGFAPSGPIVEYAGVYEKGVSPIPYFVYRMSKLFG